MEVFKYSDDIPSTRPFINSIINFAERHKCLTWIDTYEIMCRIEIFKVLIFIIYPYSYTDNVFRIWTNKDGIEYIRKIRNGEYK